MVVLLVIVLAVAAFAVSQYFSTEGYTKVWPGGVLQVSGDTIVLGANCTAIVADTTEERADAIADALANRTGERPDTWTSWVNSLRSFNITVEAVQIQRYDGTYYYSDILLRGFTDQEKVLRLDVRPSDSIAFAIRAGAPIYINSTLLREDGKNICIVTPGPPV